MEKNRLEAFSDGVLAIIITIMVLELKVPEGHSIADLKPLMPVFVSYILSFINVGIYWGNHHHLLQTLKKTNATILLANLHLLFWLSILPFTTGWMGENNFAGDTLVLYSVNLFLCGMAYFILQKIIEKTWEGDKTHVQEALKKQSRKGLISQVFYLISIIAAFYKPAISGVLIVLVALMWMIPDRTIEKAIDR